MDNIIEDYLASREISFSIYPPSFKIQSKYNASYGFFLNSSKILNGSVII